MQAVCFQGVLEGQRQRLCSQARAIVNKVVDYFAQLKMRIGGHGLLKRKLEATGK